MSVCDLPDYVVDLVNKIAKSEGFTEFNIVIKPGSNHGDNFMSVLTSAIISGARVNVNGDSIGNDELYLLCKLAPSNPVRRKEFHSVIVFQREVKIYQKILPLFAEFQREKGLAPSDSFIAYPKCYEAIADEEKDQFVIIMEDLRPQGFAMWPKFKGTPANHELLVMEHLGKLHGISFALKDQRPDAYEELKELDDLIIQFFNNESMTNVVNLGFDRAVAVLEDNDHKRIMEDVRANSRQYFIECLKEGVCEPFGVVGHGDCWNNNIIYLHKDGVSILD